ncbi:hypothetical protein C8Q75DRAFT_757708 [Abortiporus biennis]|nr:hypothetical protein C8Q75DRAFT_757708 [Abortiporus biennis]
MGYLLSLNLDVLIYLITFIPSDDLLRLSYVCRLTYTISSPQLLRFVTLRGVEKVITLWRCVSAHTPNRGSFIRSLHISNVFPYGSDINVASRGTNWCRALICLLQNTQNLYDFSIFDLKELRIPDQIREEISRQLSTLRSLQILQLDNHKKSLPCFITNMLSRPQEMILRCTDYKGNVSLELPFPSSRLRKLTLSGYSLFDLSPDFQCQALEELRCTRCTLYFPCLVQAFPNLRTLLLSGTNDFRRKPGPLNCHAIKNYGNRRWHSLDHLIANIWSADNVANYYSDHEDDVASIPIRWVEILEISAIESEYDTRDLARTLKKLQPTVVSLSIDPSNISDLPSYFITSLYSAKVLRVTLVEEAHIEDIVNFLSNLQTHFSSLKNLIAFCLCIRRKYNPVSVDEVDGPEARFQVPDIIAHAIPSTKYIGLDLSAFPDVRPIWFRVSRTPSVGDDEELSASNSRLSDVTSDIVTSILLKTRTEKDAVYEVESLLASWR